MTITLPRARPWPKPTRQEQIYEQPCWSFLAGEELDGYALEHAKGSLSSWNNPGSANHAALKRVARYGAAIRLDKSKLTDAAAACYFIFQTQSDPKYGFLNMAGRNEYSRGHLGLHMLAVGAAWVLATQEDKGGEWSGEIAKGAQNWYQRLYGNLDMLSYKGVVLGFGWRDAADLEDKNDDTLAFLKTGVMPKRPAKQWTNLNDAGVSVLYQLWTLRVLQDLGLITHPFPMKNPDPCGLPMKVLEGLPPFIYQNEVLEIVPRKEIMRWAYRVDQHGDIWCQRQVNPTTKMRPSEEAVPFVKVGRI